MEFRAGDLVKYNFDNGFLQGILVDNSSNRIFPLKLMLNSACFTFTSSGKEFTEKAVVLTLVSRPKKTVIKYQWLLQQNRSGNCYVTQEKYSESEILMTYLGGSKLISRIEESAEEFEVEED